MYRSLNDDHVCAGLTAGGGLGVGGLDRQL